MPGRLHRKQEDDNGILEVMENKWIESSQVIEFWEIRFNNVAELRNRLSKSCGKYTGEMRSTETKLG